MPRDLRFALRRLARTPGFVAAAVTCLALGIGANTAIFSVINAVLLRPLPYETPEHLVGIWEASDFRRSERNTVSPANYQDWQSASRSFSGMAAVSGGTANLGGGGQPVEVSVQGATANLFEVLGIRPALGRTFVAADDRTDAPHVALLSHGLWQRDRSRRLRGHRLPSPRRRRRRGIPACTSSDPGRPNDRHPRGMSEA